MVAMFVDGSGLNEQSLEKTFHRCFLPSFTSFGWGVSEEKIKMWKVNGRQTTDAKWWQKFTLPLARWAKNVGQIMTKKLDINFFTHQISFTKLISLYIYMHGFQYFSSVPVRHYLQAVLFIKIWTIFLYNTL
jgi:hypothetical protein